MGKLTALILALTMTLTLFGCSAGQEEEGLTEVKVCEVTHSVFYAPQYAAMHLGFFEEEGIEVELTNGGGADKVMAAVLSGDMDIGFAGPEACIYVYNEGRDDYPKVFAQVTKRDGSFLIGREENEDFQWEDVKGKVVIPGRKGGVPYMTLCHVLRKNGVDPESDTTLDDSIQFDLMAGAFSAGNADFVTLFEPTASAVVAEGKGYYMTSVGAEAGEIPYTAYFASQSFMAENAEVVQGFTNALAKGLQWVEEHSAEEVAARIAPSFPDSGEEDLAVALQSYKDIDAWNETPVMKEEAFMKLQQVMQEAGELEETVPFAAVVDNSFAEEAA